MAGVEEEFQDLKRACCCVVAESRHSFTCVSDSVMDRDFIDVKAACEEVARAEEKWMFLLRCRVCGKYWTEACYDRGQVMFYYLFPASRSADPVRWLKEEAEELPAR